MTDYDYTPDRILHAFDRVMGHLLGVVVQIRGDQVTYRGVGTRALHTERACWLNVWEG